MSKISRFVFGAYTLALKKERAHEAMNVLVTNNIPFGQSREENGEVFIMLTRRGLRRYLAATGGFRFGEKAVCSGIPELLRRYRLRTGVFIGIFIFIASVTLSSFFIWDINVTGNVNITTEEIRERLSAYGVREGAFIPSLDMNDVASRVLLEAGNISFLKINMRGTVASVEVRERRESGSEAAADSPSNLVAKYSGQIERLEVLGGSSQVAYLQPVKKGELLVSGIIDSTALGYRLVRSRGKVFARVTLAYESEIPLETTEKTYTGKEICKKNIIFFGNSLNISKNTSVSYDKYDTIINKEKIYLFGKIELPIFVVTQTFREYREEKRTLSESEALACALSEIDKKSREELSYAEILSRETKTETREGSVFMRTEVYCILDIAEEVKIETD
jgi:similar to stage IV sporulation protein